jgi:hypothetical protein
MEEELIKKNIRMNRFKIIMDIILVIVLLGIFYYVYSEIELFKILGQDVCRMCQEKTGAICYTSKYNVIESVLN